MSIARHHAEWLSLVPVSGPFLSLPVLLGAFPQGLDAHDPEYARLLRLAYEEWEDGCARGRRDPALHAAWIRFVLTKTLEFDVELLVEGQAIPQTLQVEVPEHHEWLRPTYVLNDPATKKPRLLIQTYPPTQNLDSYVPGSPWKASPDTRMTELLHGAGIRLGLVTNGERWMLVDAPKGETSGYASWYASLWLEEKITLQAFRSLLSATRFFGVADDETIEALLAKSASNQQEVTEQLGDQVRKAVEVLIQSLDKADQDRGRELLAGVSEAVLYESALTVMMRLVFLFCAEERELIPTKPFPVYEQNYSVSTISEQLRDAADQHGEELLERRFDAWPRLLSAFRAVYGGLGHDDVYLPAYGGRLFDPDRFPFLEGRPRDTNWRTDEASPLPVNNRTVLHLLEALQILQVKVPGGGPAEARRLSFRALDIEQIGHVYEGLLDHTAKRATEPTLGLIGKKEPEFPLAVLEQKRAKGEKVLHDFLKAETGGSRKWEKYLDLELDDRQAARLRTACGNDEALFQRALPFAGLVRDDTFGYPVVIPEGSVFVTAGTDRRSSGTHYTPRSLTEPIVRYTLEPLVYVGPAEGKPKEEWKLRSAAELLDLRICDMACGSGAFLVQAARYMAERLLEAWDAAAQANPDVPGITPEGKPSSGKSDEALIPDDPAERMTYAMRIVAQRCLYGVDINPLAAEMAKLSLWLLTLAKDKPFEFLDHSIRCGDSLIGLHDLDQLKYFSLNPNELDQPLFRGEWLDGVEEAIERRQRLATMPANTVEDLERQERLLKEADDKIARLRCAADLLVAGEFWGENTKDKVERVRHFAVVAGHYVENGPTEEFEEKAEKERRGQRMFHWSLEFPEAIVKRGGFDAFVGNPPFVGGKFISPALGDSYARFLKERVLARKGSGDLVVFFYHRAFGILSSSGEMGFIGTKTIVQGDTREVGLSYLIERHGCIRRAVSPRSWPGQAGVHFLWFCLSRGGWQGEVRFDEEAVEEINSYLEPGADLPDPHRLIQRIVASSGISLLGEGFILTDEERWAILKAEPSCANVVRPFMNGADFVRQPDMSPSRFAIDFGDMPESEARAYGPAFHRLVESVKPQRDRLTRQVHEACFWKHWDKRPDLQRALAALKLAIVFPLVSKYIVFGRVATGTVYSHKLGVFPSDSVEDFAVLQSQLHTAWAEKLCSTRGDTFNYAISDCLSTFPFPSASRRCADAGLALEIYRKDTLARRSAGLTQIYNRLHDPDETAADIKELRDLHIEMDQAVASAYGWNDLNLGHGFHETKQGIRFTISKSARREVLQRLLKLNHERHEEDVRQGMHAKNQTAKKPARKNTAKKPAPPTASLFDAEQDG